MCYYATEWLHSFIHGCPREPFGCGSLSSGKRRKSEHSNRGKQRKQQQKKPNQNKQATVSLFLSCSTRLTLSEMSLDMYFSSSNSDFFSLDYETDYLYFVEIQLNVVLNPKHLSLVSGHLTHIDQQHMKMVIKCESVEQIIFAIY